MAGKEHFTIKCGAFQTPQLFFFDVCNCFSPLYIPIFSIALPSQSGANLMTHRLRGTQNVCRHNGQIEANDLLMDSLNLTGSLPRCMMQSLDKNILHKIAQTLNAIFSSSSQANLNTQGRL